LSERTSMATRRLSRLQRHILRCLLMQYQRTNGAISMGHRELVQTLRQDKSNISHSLHTLAARGLIVIGRTSGGKAESLDLTAEGQKVAAELE
jgi:DNA-binding MarR family transcriptional regulator